MNLYTGKILKINLTNKSITTVPLNMQWARDFIGAWGLGFRYFWDSVSPDVDPLSPENAVVIMTGPFTGTSVPMTSRFCAVSKSPTTGTIFETNVGGSFGPELKYAGYDGIIISGRADGLSYIEIKDNSVAIKSADDLAGKEKFETENLLKDKIGIPEAKALTIGSAGENQVAFACVGTEYYRQMGRCGLGAIFGNKNLKGIVCRGTGSVAVANMSEFIDKVDYYMKSDVLTEANMWAKEAGTPGLVDVTNELGLHPTRNFTYGENKERESINSDAVQKAKIADRACTSCPMACGNFTHIDGAEVEGPEYETLCLGGSNCEINHLGDVIRFNRMCDDLGLDTISTGAVIGLAMDMTEKGRHDFGLKFGEAKDYLKVVTEIATKSTDRGRDLAMGSKKLAEKYNSDDLTSEIKGLELAAYDPRANYGMGLAYATSERGGCHLRAWTVADDDVFNVEKMATRVASEQNRRILKYSVSFCEFYSSVTVDIMADLLSVGLGEEIEPKELNMVGERTWNLGRLFNIRAGFTSEDDALPKKHMTTPLKKGPHAGRVFSLKDFETAKQLYYKACNWDEKGVPTTEKLIELGLNQL